MLVQEALYPLSHNIGDSLALCVRISLPAESLEEDIGDSATLVAVEISGLQRSWRSAETWHSECLGEAVGKDVV